MTESRTTKNHQEIQKWVEARGGFPATVKSTETDHEPGLLRIDFDGKDAALKRIDWDAFFEKFEEEDLTFLYQDETQDGQTSRFCKFINDDSSD